MSIHGFNSAKCEQRNRIAAARFGVDAVPLKFRGANASKISGDGFTVLKSAGTFPQTTEDALALINSKLPDGAAPLEASDIYLQFPEAANSNFVGDRSMYLAESTLRNIATGGEDGVSFMNAHRTGGLSTPSELPFGQTFSGIYEEGFDADGLAARRAILGVYLLRGVKPNGDGGPSTDDLDTGFRAGTVKDVSVGLHDGEAICDICGHGLNATAKDDEGYTIYLCPHVPGTHRAMRPEEIEAQKQRDARNSKGVATYSLHDSTLGEVSAVYDGAVPGAGIRKVMSLSRRSHQNQNEMTREQFREMLTEAYEFYGQLLPFDLGEVVEIKPLKNESAANSGATSGGNRMAHKATKLNDESSTPTNVEETNAEETRDETQSGSDVDDVASDVVASDDAIPESDPPVVDDAANESDNAEPASSTRSQTDAPSVEAMSDVQLRTELQRAQTQLASQDAQLRAQRRDNAKSARENFAASLSKKVPKTAQETFSTLYSALQNGTATTSHLEAVVAAMPQAALFSGIDADVTGDLAPVAPPAADDPYAKDVEATKAFVARNNRKKAAPK